MNTLGWVLAFIGVIILQRVAKGRTLNIPEDLGDAFQAFINGNQDALSEIVNRTGETATPSVGETVGEGVASALGTDAAGRLSEAQKSANQNLAYWAIKLGEAAKGYRFSATGPDYYDCSGLVYRAAQKIGYTGPRFWTGNVAAMPGMHKLASTGMGISQVTHGDIVVWPGHHMGVVIGNNRMYSARSVKSGISESAIKGFRSGDPIYLRFTPPSGGG